jgi:hypothetical protein
MKNLYIFFLALGVYSNVFSQIPEIKRLPVQEISQSFKEPTFFNLLRLETTLNCSGLASGVYIYQLKVNDFITSKKMLLIK